MTPDLDVMAGAYLDAIGLHADGLADWWGTRLDTAGHALQAHLEAPAALADAAIWYAAHGLPIFPLTPGTKIPLPGTWGCCGGSHRRGCLDALPHPGAARAWWRQHPASNIGLATGHLVDVIDQDGTAGAVQWCRGANWPPIVGIVSTPRPGGIHRYIQATGYGNGTQIAPGLDYRGRGGYVVCPPSMIDGRRYAWIQPLNLGGN